MRDHLTGVAPFIPKAQPIGVFLPSPRPGGVVHHDVDAQNFTRFARSHGAVQLFKSARSGLREVDHTGQARLAQLRHQVAALHQVRAQGFFHEIALPCSRCLQGIAFSGARWASQIHDIRTRHGGLGTGLRIGNPTAWGRL
jgi:hypothetical protein